MKKPFGLYSFDNETKYSGICTQKELTEEAIDIITEYDLTPIVFTQKDVEDVWSDFSRDGISDVVTHSVVSSSKWKEHYDLRKVCWLYEWYGRWLELKALNNQRPLQRDYLMFFTIRGDIDWLNLKQTSFCKCLKYMRQLGMQKWRRENGRNDEDEV